MDKKTCPKNTLVKRTLSTLAIFIGCVLLISGAVQGTFTRPEYPTILLFEGVSPVHKKTLEAGTAVNQWGMPTTLRAVFPINADGFRQTEPPVWVDGGYVHEQYGYTAPDEEAALRAANQPVLYTVPNKTGGVDYRVYGTRGGVMEGFYACDGEGNIFGIVLDVYVTWYGKFDAEAPGDYIFTSRIVGYDYSGEMPTALINLKASTD